MIDDSEAAVQDAFETVVRALRDRAATSGVLAEDTDSVYRIAYRLCMAGTISDDQLTAVDHFRRAHGLLIGRSVPPSPEATADFIAAARQLVEAVGHRAVAA